MIPEKQNGSDMNIAVIVVNWQRPQDTIECITSVKKSLYDNLDIIVVDNGSQDNSLQIIRETQG